MRCSAPYGGLLKVITSLKSVCFIHESQYSFRMDVFILPFGTEELMVYEEATKPDAMGQVPNFCFFRKREYFL